MGNQSSNYNNTYNAWILYRSQLKPSSASSQTNSYKFPQPFTPRGSALNVTPNSMPNAHLNSFKPVVSVISNTPAPTKSDLAQPPTGNKIPPVPKQSQQSEIKRSSIIEVNPYMLKTELVEQKVMSTPTIPGAQQKILLSNRQNSKDKKIKFSSKIDLIDTFKSEVKATRTKIDNIANSQQREFIWILSQIQNQKINLIPDRNKLIYLLKQAKDYETLIIGLRTKRQEVVKVLNELNQHQYNDSLKQSITQANKYIDSIQQQFVKIDWKSIIMEASTNIQRYVDVINQAMIDSVVQYSLVMIEKQVDALRPPPPPQLQSPTSEPEPTHQLPQNSLTNSKILKKQQITQKLKSSELKNFQNIISSCEQEDEAALRSSQQLVRNIQRSSIRASTVQQSLEMNEFGLKITASLDTEERKKSPPVRSSLQESSNKMSMLENDNITKSEMKGNIQELSEIKNVKTEDEVKVADIKPIKPVVNGFQSMVRPPPLYNPFSMPKNLLQ